MGSRIAPDDGRRQGPYPRAQRSWPKLEGALNQVFDEISFEMGVGGEKYELILTPEGDKVKLFELVYFQKHAPKEVLEHWNILVGRQPSPNTGLRTEDAGTSPGRMCRSGWRSRVKTVRPLRLL